MTYTCKNYGYGNYTRMVRYYIKNLYDNSIDYYNKVYGDVHPTGTKDLDLEKIKEFIVSRANSNKQVTIQELNISNDEDFILSILAMLRGDEKELPFKVEFEEGYLQVKNYLVPNIKFIMKEGKR